MNYHPTHLLLWISRIVWLTCAGLYHAYIHVCLSNIYLLKQVGVSKGSEDFFYSAQNHIHVSSQVSSRAISGEHIHTHIHAYMERDCVRVAHICFIDGMTLFSQATGLRRADEPVSEYFCTSNTVTATTVRTNIVIIYIHINVCMYEWIYREFWRRVWLVPSQPMHG